MGEEKKKRKKGVCLAKNDRGIEDGVDGGEEANVASEQEKGEVGMAGIKVVSAK